MPCKKARQAPPTVVGKLPRRTAPPTVPPAVPLIVRPAVPPTAAPLPGVLIQESPHRSRARGHAVPTVPPGHRDALRHAANIAVIVVILARDPLTSSARGRVLSVQCALPHPDDGWHARKAAHSPAGHRAAIL